MSTEVDIEQEADALLPGTLRRMTSDQVIPLARVLVQAERALAATKMAMLLTTPRSVSCLYCRYPVAFDGNPRPHQSDCPLPAVAEALAAIEALKGNHENAH